MSYRYELPWPPTVNQYWRPIPGSYRRVVSKPAREFRRGVIVRVLHQGRPPRPLTTRLRVLVEAFPSADRTRDLDNILKALLDALQHAGVYEDDGQIDELRLVRGAARSPGFVIVTVEELAAQT